VAKEKLDLVHCLRIPIHRTKTFNRSFTVTACRLWNSLPDPVKQIESRERFVAELRRRYLDRMIVAGGEATLCIVTENGRVNGIPTDAIGVYKQNRTFSAPGIVMLSAPHSELAIFNGKIPSFSLCLRQRNQPMDVRDALELLQIVPIGNRPNLNELIKRLQMRFGHRHVEQLYRSHLKIDKEVYESLVVERFLDSLRGSETQQTIKLTHPKTLSEVLTQPLELKVVRQSVRGQECVINHSTPNWKPGLGLLNTSSQSITERMGMQTGLSGIRHQPRSTTLLVKISISLSVSVSQSPSQSRIGAVEFGVGSRQLGSSPVRVLPGVSRSAAMSLLGLLTMVLGKSRYPSALECIW
ncbi:hypothetical protein J6590_090616, partial [Homalodisca vitripennis]